jgi:tRNA G37 N-methylase Trm5
VTFSLPALDFRALGWRKNVITAACLTTSAKNNKIENKIKIKLHEKLDKLEEISEFKFVIMIGMVESQMERIIPTEKFLLHHNFMKQFKGSEGGQTVPSRTD